MRYFGTLKECKTANPNARWFYMDRKGIGGQTRWFASKRIINKAMRQLELAGYSVDAARKQGLNTFRL